MPGVHPLGVETTHGFTLLLIEMHSYARRVTSAITLMTIVSVPVVVHVTAITALVSRMLLMILALVTAGMIRFLGIRGVARQHADYRKCQNMATVQFEPPHIKSPMFNWACMTQHVDNVFAH